MLTCVKNVLQIENVASMIGPIETPDEPQPLVQQIRSVGTSGTGKGPSYVQLRYVVSSYEKSVIFECFSLVSSTNMWFKV